MRPAHRAIGGGDLRANPAREGQIRGDAMQFTMCDTQRSLHGVMPPIVWSLPSRTGDRVIGRRVPIESHDLVDDTRSVAFRGNSFRAPPTPPSRTRARLASHCGCAFARFRGDSPVDGTPFSQSCSHGAVAALRARLLGYL